MIPTKIYVELFQNSSRKLVSFQKNIFMIPVRNRFPVFCVMTIIWSYCYILSYHTELMLFCVIIFFFFIGNSFPLSLIIKCIYFIIMSVVSSTIIRVWWNIWGFSFHDGLKPTPFVSNLCWHCAIFRKFIVFKISQQLCCRPFRKLIILTYSSFCSCLSYLANQILQEIPVRIWFFLTWFFFNSFLIADMRYYIRVV